jgi:UDP-N-acetylglucosamine 2-epimerase (non-hydrolysing)
MKILSVVSSRADLMQISAVCEAIDEHNSTAPVKELDHLLVHTGYPHHADFSRLYFNDLNLPEPSLFLEVETGSRALETARIMERFETVLLEEKPDLVLLLGHGDPALACALVTKKTVCFEASTQRKFVPKLGHIAAGLRSFDRQSSEEMNRVMIDAIADFLFTSERSACANLAGEGIPQDKVHFVGNLRIDTLLRYRPKAEQSTILSDLQLINGKGEVRPYGLLTLHRSENLKDKAALYRILGALLEITRQIAVIFPAHPASLRTIDRADLGEFFIDHSSEGPEPWDRRVRIRLIPALGYLDFVCLMSRARMVFADSRGIQGESAILGVPCIVLRHRTESPTSGEAANSVLAGSDPHRIVEEFRKTFRACKKITRSPEAWDGSSARRIVQILREDRFRQAHAPFAAAGSSLRGMNSAASEQTL